MISKESVTSSDTLQDTGLQTAGTALISAGIALVSSANGDVNQLAGGVLMSAIGLGCFWLKYANRG